MGRANRAMEYELVPDEAAPLSAGEPRPPARPAVLLVVVCLLTVGSHVGRHFLSSLGPQLIERMAISRLAFGLTFSSQEIPGVLIPLVGGILISASRLRFGAAALVLAAFVTVGQAMSAVAIHVNSYSALLVGRFVFGVGDGCLVVVQGAIVGERFKDGRISSAFGTLLLCSRLSSFVGLATPGPLSSAVGLVPAVYISSAVCLLSLVAAAVYTYALESKSERLAAPEGRSLASFCSQVLATVTRLRPEFWLVACCWATLASAVFTFVHFAADISRTSPNALLAAHAMWASVLSSGILLLSGVLSPLAGHLQDSTGRRIELLGLSFGLTCAGIPLCAAGAVTSALPTLVGLLLIAAGFAVAPVTLLSCVALVVEREHLPAALGLYKASENMVLSVAHFVAGALHDATGNYTLPLLFLSLTAGVGLAAVFGLRRSSSSAVLTAASPAVPSPSAKGSPAAAASP